MRKCTYYNQFFIPKLIWTRLSNINSFAISEDGEFSLDSTSFAITNNLKYVLAILNSNVILFYFKLGAVIWGKDGIKWFGNYFDNIPIPNITPEAQLPFIALVEKILQGKKDRIDTGAWEKDIDEMVYKLYDLTPEEVDIVEGK